MIEATFNWLLALAKRGSEHRSRVIRRTAQLAVLALSAVDPTERADASVGGPEEPQAQLVGRLFASTRLRDYVRGRGLVRPWFGVGVRALLLRVAAIAKMRNLAVSGRRAVVFRVDGLLEQTLMRNLFIWHHDVLGADPSRNESCDLILLLPREQSDARLFDLLSIALMLERVRNVAVFWDEEGIAAAVPMFMSAAQQIRWRDAGNAEDLRRLSERTIDEVIRGGTSGGIKLLVDGRMRAQDFLKAALPGRFIVAISMREDQDGAADPSDLDFWMPLLDAAAARDPNVAFVVLNRLTLRHWRAWPAHVRFARHQGLSLQDALCLTQVADGYIGVLDIFGLVAKSAGRPGVYVPLTDADAQLWDYNQTRQVLSQQAAVQIVLGGRDPAAIQAELEKVLSIASSPLAGSFPGR